MLTVAGGDADLVDCSLRDNFMGAQNEGVGAGGNGASIALHRPAFSGNFGEGFLLTYAAAAQDARSPYSTDETSLAEYCLLNDGAQPTQPLAMSDTNMAAMQSWLQWKRMVRLLCDAPCCPSHAWSRTFPTQQNWRIISVQILLNAALWSTI